MNLLHILYGMIIGVANIIPGVSGGTIAVVLKVYDTIIDAISGVTKNFKKSVITLLPFGIGAGVGILLFSKIVEFCLEKFPTATNMAFVGLIIGSIPMIYSSTFKSKPKLSTFLCFLAGFGTMLFMLFVTPDDSSATLITELTVANATILFLSGVIAAATMIIPGISGSFVLLLIGVYSSILAAISALDIVLLIPFGIGVCVGILACAKIIEKLFSVFPAQTYSVILGLMFGSIFIILPPLAINIETFISIPIALGMAYTAYRFSKT